MCVKKGKQLPTSVAPNTVRKIVCEQFQKLSLFSSTAARHPASVLGNLEVIRLNLRAISFDFILS